MNFVTRNFGIFFKHAEVIRHWAGLRPHRSSGVRIETEKFSGGKMVSILISESRVLYLNCVKGFEN